MFETVKRSKGKPCFGDGALAEASEVSITLAVKASNATLSLQTSVAPPQAPKVPAGTLKVTDLDFAKPSHRDF